MLGVYVYFKYSCTSLQRHQDHQCPEPLSVTIMATSVVRHTLGIVPKSSLEKIPTFIVGMLWAMLFITRIMVSIPTWVGILTILSPRQQGVNIITRIFRPYKRRPILRRATSILGISVSDDLLNTTQSMRAWEKTYLAVL